MRYEHRAVRLRQFVERARQIFGLGELRAVHLQANVAPGRVLGLHQIAAISVEVVGPDVRTRFSVDQLHVDLNPVAKPSHAPFEHVMNA